MEQGVLQSIFTDILGPADWLVALSYPIIGLTSNHTLPQTHRFSSYGQGCFTYQS